MRFMAIVIFSKGGSIVECDDRNTSKSIAFSKQEVPVLRGLGWTCSRAVVNQPSTCQHLAWRNKQLTTNLRVFFDGC